MRVSKSWGNFHFGVNYHFKCPVIALTLLLQLMKSYILSSPPILNTTNQYIKRREGQEMDG